MEPAVSGNVRTFALDNSSPPLRLELPSLPFSGHRSERPLPITQRAPKAFAPPRRYMVCELERR